MATNAHTTPPVPLPSLFDIGRLQRDKWREIGAIDERRLAIGEA